MPGERHEGGENERGQVEELDGAVADLREQVGVGAELVGREEPDVEPAGGRLADAVDRLLGADVDRMGRVLAGRELEVELGGGRRPVEDGDRGSGGAGGKQRSARDRALGGHVIVSSLSYSGG